MLSITGIKKGIVIDHIPCGFGIRIFNMLELNSEDSVALIMNVKSNKMGRKDIVKIENNIKLNLDILGIISKDITVNIIKDDKIEKKYQPDVPKVIKNIIKCKNPRCVTTSEDNIVHKFNLIDPDKKEYSCDYCEDIVLIDKLI